MSSSTQQAAPPTDTAGNAGIAMFAKALYLATRLCVPPLVLAHITLAEYGLWTACFVLIMYIGLSDAGFSNVYVRYSARYHAAGDVGGINRLLSTGVFLLSAIALAVLAGVWALLPAILDFLKIAATQREQATVLVMGAAAMFLLDLTLGAYCYLLHGLQRIKEEQKVAIAGYLLELLLIFVFLRAGFGVYALLLAFTLRYAWSLLAFMRLAHRFLPGLQIRLRHFDKNMLRHFFGFGAKVQASALLGTALYSADRLLAGFLLGPKGIALFELAAKLPVSALAVPSAISNVTLASASGHAAREQLQSIRELHQQATRSVSMLAAIPLAFMAAFSGPIGSAWLGKGGELGSDLLALPTIMALSALWSHLHIVTGPGSAVFRAMGKAGNEFVYHGLRFVLLALCIGAALWVLPAATAGLAWGLAFGGAAAASAYLVYNQRYLGLPLEPLLIRILLPGAAAYPVAAALRLAWDLALPATTGRWESVAWLALFGTAYLIAYLLLAWTWLLDEAERLRLAELCGKFLGRLPQWKTV